MADALDLHHRLPRTWAAVHTGQVETWVARKIATLTHDLDPTAARTVDDHLAPVLATLPTARLLTLAEARVVAADPAAADTRAAKARTTRTLRLGRPDRDPTTETLTGTTTLHARLETADALRFHATATALAHLLADHQQTTADPHDPHDPHDPSQVETLEELRARAMGILADPALALALLTGDDTPRPSATRPRTVLYVHTTPDQLTPNPTDNPTDNPTGPSAARAEDLGPLTRRQLIRLLGHEHITIRPVIDLNDHVAADCYEIPTPLAERLHLTRPYDVFPHAPSLSRSLDLDHTQPYQHPREGHPPPGQTRIDNLGKLTRRHHRIKTHHPGWTVHQTNGVFTWTTPHGKTIHVDHHGTHHIDRPPPRRQAEYYRTTIPIHLAYTP